MALQKTYTVFVSYAEADKTWCQGYLIPELHLDRAQIITPDDFRLGAVRVKEFERAVNDSSYTILVFTPEFLNSEWAAFSQQLIGYLSVEEQAQQLIPLVLKPTQLSLQIRSLIQPDFTTEANWDAEVKRLRAALGTPPEPMIVKEIVCPYPGMRPFDEQSRQFFYGRNDEIDNLLKRLELFDQIFVIGPSGSGKSSLVFAGLVPELDDNKWTVKAMRPGAKPLNALKEAFREKTPDAAAPKPPDVSDAIQEQNLPDAADAPEALIAVKTLDGKRCLLIVDQLEELFAQAEKASQKNFFEAIKALRATKKCVVIFTLRADFYPELMESEFWEDATNQRVDITPLRGQALRAAIAQPALKVGVYLEPALVQRLIDAAADEPGCMPLLQETLRFLWDKRQQRLLTLSAYEALEAKDGRSGLAVAMEVQADASLNELSEKERKIARRIFVRLVQFGEGRSDTRRQQIVDALKSDRDEPGTFQNVLNKLTSYRLLTLTDDENPDTPPVVNISHEMLILGWPKSRQWVQERRSDELTRRRLVESAKQWRDQNRDPSLLYRGLALATARAWSEANPDELQKDEREFLDASIQQHSRNRRLRRAALIAATVVVVLVLIPPALFLRQTIMRLHTTNISPMVHFDTSSEGDNAVAPFSIDQYEVSYEQYRYCYDAGICSLPLEEAGDDRFASAYSESIRRLPVVSVTGQQAWAYCAWLGRRLPTSAEWERAAYGEGIGREYPWVEGEADTSRVNASIGTYEPGAVVAVDDDDFEAGDTPEHVRHMLGNVWEWTSTIAPGTCPEGTAVCEGEWDGVSRPPGQVSMRGLSFRSQVLEGIPRYETPNAIGVNFVGDDIGFRCAAS